MKQFLNVLKFELGNYFKSKSFMVTTILLALAVAAAVALPPVFMKGSFSEVFGGSKGSTEATGEEAAEGSSADGNYDSDADVLAIADPDGFVSDITELTDRMPGYNWKVFDDTDEVEDIVSAGAKGGFILTGRYTYTYVVNDLSILDSLDSKFSEIYTDYWQEQELKAEGIDAAAVEEILGHSSISDMKVLGKDGANNYWYTYILIFVLYFLVLFYGQMIATSITSEKSNRAIEVLVTTVDSTSLIFGKVIAGAISGIFQAGVILGLSFHRSRLGLPAGFPLPYSGRGLGSFRGIWSSGLSHVCLPVRHAGSSGFQDRGYQQICYSGDDDLCGILYPDHDRNERQQQPSHEGGLLHSLHFQQCHVCPDRAGQRFQRGGCDFRSDSGCHCGGFGLAGSEDLPFRNTDVWKSYQIYAGIEKDPGAVNLLSEKIFTHHRKGGGADLKDLLMEGFQREGAALFLFIGVPEIFEGKIAHIVTEIVGRGFEKGLVEGLGRGLLKAEFT